MSTIVSNPYSFNISKALILNAMVILSKTTIKLENALDYKKTKISIPKNITKIELKAVGAEGHIYSNMTIAYILPASLVNNKEIYATISGEYILYAYFAGILDSNVAMEKLRICSTPGTMNGPQIMEDFYFNATFTLSYGGDIEDQEINVEI